MMNHRRRMITNPFNPAGGNPFGEATAARWDPLVLDLDGDGLISGDQELFGDKTVLASGEKAADGFAALADLDGNGDGKIDASDANFANIRVWRDANGDGYSHADELYTLEELGIQSLDVTGNASGNTQVSVGSYQKQDGRVHSIGQYLFDNDPIDSTATDYMDVPEDIQTLPYLYGGRLEALRKPEAIRCFNPSPIVVLHWACMTADDFPQKGDLVLFGGRPKKNQKRLRPNAPKDSKEERGPKPSETRCAQTQTVLNGPRSSFGLRPVSFRKGARGTGERRTKKLTPVILQA